MLKKEKSEMGRKNRASGARFELQVRKNLEGKGWITDKWTKNVDLDEKKLIPAKRKFNPYKKILGIGTGFPDFIAFKQIVAEKKDDFQAYNVIGVEVKSSGVLEKLEKEKCSFLLENNIFKEIIIAKKGEKRGEIKYLNFKTKEDVSLF